MYTFKNTEINNKKASEFETKSMLYLLGMHVDSAEIELVTVDCFNDVTGATEDFSKLWDVQSKNHSSLPPSKIGESLLTLYKNYVSSLLFFEYILFIPKLDRKYLKDGSLNIYDYSNIKDKQKKGIEKKLKECINGNSNGNTPTLFSDFLSQITFIEDNKNISAYIKKISKFKNKKFISEKVYEKIFEEIRNAQSSLKMSEIEGEVISHPSEVLKFKRHITKKQISTLLINRFVGIDIFSFPGIPTPFYPTISGKDIEEIKDILQDCNENLSKAFFDKNGCKEFWKVSEIIISIIKSDLNQSVSDVYSKLLLKTAIKTNYLTKQTVEYMISLVITGLEN